MLDVQEVPAVSEHILELRNVSKSFSGVEVLHHVSLALRPGEVHALLGENGAGKSMLVKVITGVHQPDAGEILLDGKPVHLADTRETRLGCLPFTRISAFSRI